MPRNAVFRLVLFAFVIPLLHSDCAKNPVTGKRELALISESQEIAIGQQSHPEVLAEYGRVDDEALQAYVDAIGQAMARDSERPDLPWHFTVVDAPVVNAFALPGGYIYITREILAYMNNEAELAGVLGHEIGHVTARHAVSQISKAQLVGLGLGLGGVFSETFRNVSDLAQLGAGVLFLKYGRDAERQSDELGARYMYEQGYDPYQMSNFFTVFERMREESGQVLPNWLSSHPAPPDRIEATQRHAEALTGGRAGDLRVNREGHLRRLEDLVFGENPREGYTEDNRFLHPDLRFQIRYPPGWKVQNTKSSVLFGEPNGAAAVQLTLAPAGSSPVSRARELGGQQGVQLVNGEQRSVNGNPSYFAYYHVQNPSTGRRIEALAAFISYRGNLYQMIGMAPPQSFRSYSNALRGILESFSELRDPRALAVQPDRVHLYRVQRGGTLRDVARRYPNPRMTIDELAALNRINPDERLAPGALVKVVEAGRR